MPDDRDPRGKVASERRARRGGLNIDRRRLARTGAEPHRRHADGAVDARGLQSAEVEGERRASFARQPRDDGTRRRVDGDEARAVPQQATEAELRPATDDEGGSDPQVREIRVVEIAERAHRARGPASRPAAADPSPPDPSPPSSVAGAVTRTSADERGQIR